MNHRSRPWRRRLFALRSLALALALGCQSEKCDPDLVDHAVEFMKAHQSCTADADCVIVPDYCGTLPGGFCGQLVMNKAGRDAAEWGDIGKELDDCSPDECTQCLAVRGVGCNNGSCNGP